MILRKDCMLELLNRYCLENANDTGLLLLDMPTGTGKTYNVIQFIKRYLKENNGKRIFFVTTLKKNVQDTYADLLRELGDNQELQDSVFRVLSNKEYAIKHFTEVKKNIQIKEIRFSEEFKSFDALISAGVDKPEVFGDIEWNFRKLISRVLSRKFKKKSEKLNAIKNDKDWKWVGDLYPVVFSEEKRVFFITMKKLIYEFDTIIEKSARLYESPLFKNSIVFFDEFDATKKEIQDMIVQRGLNKSIDYIDLFRNIKICLDNQGSIPSNILDNVEDKPSHKQALEKNIKIFDEIANEYHLLQHHKSIGFDDKRFVLFSDFTHNNYVTGNENIISVFDEKKNINTLKLVSKNESDRSLYEALDKIKGAISHFSIFVAILASSYRKNKTSNGEESKSYGEFTKSHALDTVLDSLHLQGDSYRIIRDMVVSYNNRSTPKTGENTELKDDIYFYSNGFSHYDFCDDYSHDNTTIIRKFVFEETPESILYTICSVSKVVGISATATFKTVLGNYDIDYLKWKLGDKYIEPTEGDKQRLRKDFENQTAGYDNIEIVVELTNTPSSTIPNWANIYKNDELVKEAHILTSTSDDKNHYKETRYYKAVLAFKQFIDSNIQSYLALFSKSLKRNDKDFDLNIVLKLFEYLVKDKECDSHEDICCVLDSDRFEEEKEKLIRALGNGERRFIISTYATIGAGQNLQYKKPYNRRFDVVKINDTRGDSEEMDIDGIYLDKPTYLVNQCGGEEENAINRVFQMEYLGQVNAISQNDKMAEIVKSYNSIGVDKDKIRNSYSFSSLRDVKVYATRTIVQAMGRKCRTNYRGKRIFILADSALADALDKGTLFSEARMFNPEMKKLTEVFEFKEETIEKRYVENAISTSINSNKRIRQLLNRCFENRWNDEELSKWKDMREYVLKFPILTKEEWEDSPFKPHYITLGKPIKEYFYQQSGDFDSNIQIDENKFEGACSFSQEDIDLTGIFKTWPRIKDLFMEKGYATEFKEGDYLMSPPLYHNIYKGALGEVVGKEIFNHFGIPLEELNKEEYESFDYKVKGKPIYVDFKYWKETAQFDADKYHNKVIEKAKKCKEIETVIIANVRDTGFDEPSTTNMNGIRIIELSLICNSTLSHKAAIKIQELK